MDILRETSYLTPLSNSTLLPLLLMSLSRQRHTPHSSPSVKDEYDYIVVGGGAAGSVLASRLSEVLSVDVLLLEAGHEPPLLTEVPALGGYFLGTDVDWQFKTVPQKYAGFGLKNREIKWASGKMLGGSASHNAMTYLRGNRKNYDDWAAQGAKGWSYEEVFPYFLRLEDFRVPAFLSNGYHSVGGPISVEQSRYTPELKLAASKAAVELGYQFVDPNAATQTGFYDIQRNMRDNQRCNSVKGYLVPAENRPNLDILLNATVTKVILQDSQASGVEIYHDGQFRKIKAKKEVILSAGTVKTPQILMLSGIGPRDELQKWKIPVITDLPVGKNLQNHATSPYIFTLNPRFPPIDEKIANFSNIWEYIQNRSGPLSSSGYILTALLNGQNVISPIDFPNFVIFFMEAAKNFLKGLSLEAEVYKQFVQPYEDRAVFICKSQQTQPKSRGTITLGSLNPFDSPLIDPNYLEDARDVEDIVDGLILCKKLVSAQPLLQLGAEPFQTLVPGCENYAGFDDYYFRCFVRNLIYSTHHAVGTSKMGDPSDPTTVVDPQLRVKNVKNLRVVDASIMPIITSGNLNIPTIMIAEKASDMIKDDFFSWKNDPLHHSRQHTVVPEDN